MQIIGSVQIVTLLHLSYQPFELHCAFDLLVLLGFTVNFALFVRMRLGSFAPAGATGTLSLDPASL